MENVRNLFMESMGKTTLEFNEQVSLFTIYTSINNLVNRLKTSNFPLPPIEAIVEVLLMKTSAEDKISGMPLVLVNDVTKYLTGQTISYVEFS